MNKLSELDVVIGESLEQANYAAKLIREIEALENKANLIDLGNAIYALWEVRNRVYALAPELKPDFVREFELNESTFNKLGEIHAKAYAFEEQLNFSEAEKQYALLLSESKLGHFKRLAESGLYRVTAKS